MAKYFMILNFNADDDATADAFVHAARDVLATTVEHHRPPNMPHVPIDAVTYGWGDGFRVVSDVDHG